MCVWVGVFVCLLVREGLREKYVWVCLCMYVRKGVKSIRMCAWCMCRRWVVKVCPCRVYTYACVELGVVGKVGMCLY